MKRDEDEDEDVWKEQPTAYTFKVSTGWLGMFELLRINFSLSLCSIQSNAIDS